MNICVIGTGYVGLVTGAAFADLGNDVICVDKVQAKIDNLKQGIMPIFEPGLEEMVERNLEDGRLQFTTDLDAAVRRTDIIFICVDTPPKEDGEADLTNVVACAKAIGEALNGYKIVVNKSTVPVGTGDLVRTTISEHKGEEHDFDVVSNPEFLREGSAIQDTFSPDRIVIGAPNHNVAMKLLELYATLERPMLITDVHSAEIIKYASNAFLATKISFANAIADLCEAAGADISHVVKGMGFDPRIGSQFLQAGLGYGGSCFPKDTEALVHTAARFGLDLDIVRATVEVNRQRVPRFLDRIRAVMGTLEGQTIALLGLAFKPNTDDLREAKSLDLIAGLLQDNAAIKTYDPAAIENTRKIFPQIEYCDSSYDAAEGADALVIVTEWNEFKLLNLDKVKQLMNRPLIFDGRNVYDPERTRRMGFEYHSVGR